MNKQYQKSLKKKVCEEICIEKKSTIRTAENYGVPLKTVENWITAYNRNAHCFDSEDDSNGFKILGNTSITEAYDDFSTEELKLQLLKKDIEIARLKKGYLVKGDGQGEKEFVIFSKKNTK